MVTVLRIIRRLLKEAEQRLERRREGIDPLVGRGNGKRSEIEQLLAKLE